MGGKHDTLSESPDDSVVHWQKFSGLFPSWPRPSWADEEPMHERGRGQRMRNVLLLANVHTYIQRGWQRASRLSWGPVPVLR